MKKDERMNYRINIRIEKSEWLRFKKLSTTGKSKIASTPSEAVRKLIYGFNRKGK